MKTSIDELARLMTIPRENENLEFKEAKNQYDLNKFFRYCVAIANEGGGKLILGITNTLPRKIVGSQAFLNLVDIQRKILNKLHFRVDAEEINHLDGRVLIFHIPSRPSGTAYQFEGAYLMRSTEDTIPMTEDRLRKIFNEAKPDWLSRVALDKISADEVIRLLDTQSYFDLMKLPYPTNQGGVLERFEKEKLIIRKKESWDISNLGAILFAKRLDDFGELLQKAPRVIIYEEKSKLKTRLDKPGIKGYAVGFVGLIDFIIDQSPANKVIEETVRREVKMFPAIAVRELVANALIHQDFNETGSSIMIELYSDRLEVSNPGKPFISTERFIDEYKSRNEQLADIMRRLGICEEKGSGVDKVVQLAEVFQLPAPDFRVSEHHTTAILYAHKKFADMDRNDRIRACYQHCCLRYVMNERMTNQSLRDRFKLSEKKSESISRIIRETIALNLIKLDDPSVKSLRYRRYVPFWA